MLIRCPECRFERQIDENAIPANAAMATCPHCQYRFRFRNPDGTPVVDETPAAAPAPQTAPAGRPLPPDLDGDDPLPPGAMVPRIPADSRGPRSRAPKGPAGPPAKRCGKALRLLEQFPEETRRGKQGQRRHRSRHACRRHRRPVGRAQALQPLHGPLPDHPAGDVQRAPLLRRPARSCSTSSSACSRPSSSACGTS